MTTINSNDIINAQQNIITNPNRMQELALTLYGNLLEGINIPMDASNPFVYTLEMAVTSAASAAIHAESVTRRLYPEMAVSEDDLYLHMADVDYINRFSTPATRMWGLTLPLDEIYGLAKPLNDGTGAKLLKIPKHTVFIAGNTHYTLQYAVCIKVMFNGTLSIYSDLSERSPIYTPITNDLKWYRTQTDSGLDFILIDVPVQQMKITSQVMQVVSFAGFDRTFSFDDYFFYARAYIKNAQGQWTEIKTTHSDQVYNPQIPTICLKVYNKTVSAYIPQIYFTNGLVNDVIRLDIYTTQGIDTEDYTNSHTTNFRFDFRDLDNEGLDTWSAPTGKFTTFLAFPRTAAVGGTAPLSFMELKRRVTQRAMVSNGLPVSSNQLTATLSDAGFDLVTKVDNITNRQYCAVRAIPAPKDNSTVTGLGCTIEIVELSLSEVQQATTYDPHSQRITLLPKTLFTVERGMIRLLSKARVEALKQLASSSSEAIASEVNSKHYYYTPYHYVFDYSEDQFDVRPYHMTSPKILSRYIYQQNTGLGVDLRSEQYTIVNQDNGQGYSLFLKLKSSSDLASFTIEQLSVQLSYLATGSTNRGYIAGRLVSPIDPANRRPVGENWVYQFDIPTDYDINKSHGLKLSDSGLIVDLEHQFDIVIVAKNFQPTGSGYGDIDTLVNNQIITHYDETNTYIGVTQEQIVISFGSYLKHLWCRSRTVVASPVYKTYDADVPAVYREDVYETDANGNIKIQYDYTKSIITYNKLHNKGDPILLSDGKPALRHRKGDPILNDYGQPVLLNPPDEYSRFVDLFLVDGRYYFATDQTTLGYVHDSLDTVTNWITNDIVTLNGRTLERTDLYYYPKASIGMIDVVVGDGTSIRTPAARSLIVTYTVSADRARQTEITSNLRTHSAKTIDLALQSLVKVSGGVVTRNDLNSTVKRLIGDDVIDVNIEGYFPEGIDSILLTDLTAIPTIGKKLVVQSNLTLIVEDDVYVQFKILDRGKANEILQSK